MNVDSNVGKGWNIQEVVRWDVMCSLDIFVYSANFVPSKFYSLALALANSTLLVQVPTPSNPTSTTSPSFSQSCGFRPIPTPCGVPVKITSPGKSVVPWLKKAIVFAIPKIMSFVLESWTIWPLTLVVILKFWGSLINFGEMMAGP